MDFLIFCNRNPKPCPLLEVTEMGSPQTVLAEGADIRTDIPKYRIYKDGVFVEEVNNILKYWTSDKVGFLLGCSFTFENAMVAAGIPIRHIEQGTIVPMYTSNIRCSSAGIFKGPMVVTMRPIPHELVVKTVQVTSRFPAVHGAPVHIGHPEHIGVDLQKPEYGGGLSKINPGETPVFWACGVTPQAVAQEIRIPFMITHSPGHMFITDIKDEHLALL
jgi:uncharacterized protein YcsI (UPF0317 family)